ncbi:MAG: cation diffusion facilitator family transporter [Bacteroidales bacterium]|nr:cation diffusion facilitator family transporter [Bacteroidales bacterium]
MSHHHGHHIHTNGKIGKNLLLATLLNFIITLFEIAGGILSNSFALISDAIHNLGDTVSMALAYFSHRLSTRVATTKQTYGFKRVEIIAAFLNGISMLVIVLYIFKEAWERIQNPEPIHGLTMIIVATIGLIANLLAVSFLQHHRKENLNVRAAYLHLIGDTLSSVLVVIGGIFIYRYRIFWLDPVLTFIIGIYILKETFSIIRQAYLILLQATPPEIDLNKIKKTLENLPDIENIHHVHAWKLNDNNIHFECHIDLKHDCRISETENILNQVKLVLKQDFNIEHTTIQFEFNCCENKAMIY